MLMSVSIFQPRNTLFPHAKTYMEKITARPYLGGGIISGCPDSQREEQAKEGMCVCNVNPNALGPARKLGSREGGIQGSKAQDNLLCVFPGWGSAGAAALH